MVCKKCGTMITDSSAELCPVCCAPLGEENFSNEDILKSDHYVDTLKSSDSYTPQLGTKWANFLGYFAFWLSAIVSIIVGLWCLSLTGSYSYRSISGAIVFSAICLIVAGIICILGALSIIKRKSSANNMVTLVYVTGLVVDILVYIAFSSTGIMYNLSTPRIVIAILMIIINRSYFEKRSNIFVN